MAKISARGAKAVAEARRTGPTDDGTAETIRTLCSDGRILQRTTFRYHACGMRANSNGHVHYATLRNPATPENVAEWVSLMTRRQWAARILYEGMEGVRAMSTKTKTKKNAKATAKSNGGFAAELDAQVAKMTKAGVAVKATKHEVKDGMPPRRKTPDAVASPDDLDQQRERTEGFVIPEMEHHDPQTPRPTEATTDLDIQDRARALQGTGGLVTFAFRLPKEDAAAIHKAAGPRNASKFAHAVLVAAAAGDLDRIKDLVEKGI